MLETIRIRENGDSFRARLWKQRAGEAITYERGDIVLIGPSYNYDGEVFVKTWSGQEWPKVLLLSSKCATPLPPRHYNPMSLAEDKKKILIDHWDIEPEQPTIFHNISFDYAFLKHRIWL